MTTTLCARINRPRTSTRSACTESGMRIDRISASELVKQVQPSATSVARKVHNTCDSARNGR